MDEETNSAAVNGAADRQPDAESDRMAQPVNDEQPPRLPFPVVGVGASAGGIEAFSNLLDAMPSDSGMSFVFVLHLPPDAESHLSAILGHHTKMPVRQVADGMPVEVNHVYVIRPGNVVTIHEGRIHLGPELGGSRAANRPVDGLCLAQDPETAQYPSMPRHLMDAGYADHVLRPEEMPDVLLRYAGSPYATGGREADAARILEREGQHLREILAVLRTRTRHDFGAYKKPTVLRRVQRRMGLPG